MSGEEIAIETCHKKTVQTPVKLGAIGGHPYMVAR
jgi:hypothetical protein